MKLKEISFIGQYQISQITTADGQTFRRNRRHLRPTCTHSECQTEPGLDDGGSSDEEEERHKQQQEQTHNIIHGCARVQVLYNLLYVYGMNHIFSG